MKWLVPLVFDPLLGQTPQDVAVSALRLLLGPEFEGVSGALFLKIRKFRRVMPSFATRNHVVGSLLWDFCDRLTDSATKLRKMSASAIHG